VILSGLFGPRLSRPRWRCEDRGRSTPHPPGPKRSGGRPGAAFLDREECERCSQGKKVATAVAVQAIETKTSFGHTQSIGVCAGAPCFNREGTRLMALISSAIPNGNPGDGTALTTAPVCTARRCRRSLTDAPSASCPWRVRWSAPIVWRLFHRPRILGHAGGPNFTTPNWRPVERNGWERFETNRLAACLYRPHRIRRRAAGLFARTGPAAPAGSRRPTSAVRRRCTAPL